MAKMSCFRNLLLAGRRKKHRKVADAATKVGCNDCPKVNPVEFIGEPRDAKVAAADHHDDETVHVASVLKGGGDRQGENKASVKGENDMPDFELEFHAAKKSGGAEKADAAATPEKGTPVAKEEATDPSPKLKRSCSNIETKRQAAAAMMPARSRSYSDLWTLPAAAPETTTLTPRIGGGAAPDASPASVRTADHVMLKKRSSSQVLPSRSRKLWWRLFLWSHRNLHPGAVAARSAAGRRRHGGGYTSDTHDEDRKNKKKVVAADDGSSPQQQVVANQEWVAFCADNSLLDRVSAWVSSIDTDPFGIDDDEYDDDDGVEEEDRVTARPRALELGEPSSSGKGHGGKFKRGGAVADEIFQANSVVQSLNAFSTVAHISGMGLKVMPMIAPFSSLRAVNLSANFIVHISPGSLPKGLHSLDLSRNKIAAIEGLRELTKLRVLNLSYNRISRIGHGLSNCTSIRELYLAGNKIGDVEGLHRLLKLAVLDLSFNKITTSKALGQLVANYHSLLALNLVGNPVQANVGDDALRRAVTGLLPNLAYLNKQPVKPQRSAREVATDSVARAALGGGRSQRRRASRRPLGSGAGDGSVRSRSKGRHHGSGSMKK